MLMRWWELERRKYDGLFCFRIDSFKDDHRSKSFGHFTLHNNQTMVMRCDLETLAMEYSGLAHSCFWQCSERRFTGNLPVHDAPPIYMKSKLVVLHEVGGELENVNLPP